MPPKPKFTKEEIVEKALGLVSNGGVEALTARELGKALGSSARPIFTVFKNMDELLDEVRKAAMQKFEAYDVTCDNSMPIFKKTGIKMVMFGIEEPKLYSMLFMSENKSATSFGDIYGELGGTADMCINALREDYDLSERDAKTVFENMWIYTFGIGALCATGVCVFAEEKLSEMLSVEFGALMNAVKKAE